MGRSVVVSPVALLGLAGLLCGGCLPGMTPAQRVQDAANDYATAIRFGRMDVAAGQVSRNAHDAFVRQHASWGSNVRVLDCELMALRLRDKDRAEVMLSVSWQRIDESETRTTQVAQRWRDDGGWRLENEERARGDVGLLGEPSDVVAPPAAPAQFRTITIR